MTVQPTGVAPRDPGLSASLVRRVSVSDQDSRLAILSQHWPLSSVASERKRLGPPLVK